MKNKVRQALKQRRDAISAREEKSHEICRRFLSSSLYRNAETIMVYKEIKSEVQTGKLIETMLQNKKRVFLPVTVGDCIEICEILPQDSYLNGNFNVPEPVNRRPFPIEKLDLIIVPALAYDRRFYRMGYGKGYYDRFLAHKKKKTITVGFCYDSLLVDELPTERFDRKVDAVITEKGVLYETQCDPD